MLKILIPVDGSEHSKRALQEAIKFAGWTDAHLIMLHVRTEYVTKLDDIVVDYRLYDREESEKRSMELLEEMVESLSAEDRARIELISQASNFAKLSLVGDVGETITHFIEREKIDYVVMGSHGINAGKIKSLLVGSITKYVLSHAPCPVLVVK